MTEVSPNPKNDRIGEDAALESVRRLEGTLEDRRELREAAESRLAAAREEAQRLVSEARDEALRTADERRRRQQEAPGHRHLRRHHPQLILDRQPGGAPDHHGDRV